MITKWPKEWDGFKEGRWSTTSVNVRDFIKKNYTPYNGDESFLAPPTEATRKLWEQVMELSVPLTVEVKRGASWYETK